MKPKIAIIGGGASALFFASQINTQLYDIQLFEQKKTLGRKLLVAGNGGFNLTHSAPVNQLVKKYYPTSFLSKKMKAFDNTFFRNYLNQMHIPTFIGSSKRVFPEPPIKPIEVLNELIKVIQDNKIQVNTQHKWIGWNNDLSKLQLMNEKGLLEVEFDKVVFCLGGKSWKKTGSDGKWWDHISQKNVLCKPFQSSNCEMLIAWSDASIQSLAGTPLKNIQVTSKFQAIKGELMITKNGIEGNAIYALSHDIRSALKKEKTTTVLLDLKPNLSTDKIIEKLAAYKKGHWTTFIKRTLKLTQVGLVLIQLNSDKITYTNPEKLAVLIKNIPLQIHGLGPIDAAISTVGGVDLSEIDENFELLKLPDHYVIGEMLDWDAPTGGYLLQGCFTMGAYLANYFNNNTVP